MLDEHEALMAGQVRDILRAAGNQVVHRDNSMALGQKSVAQVRPEKAGSASDQNSHAFEAPWITLLQSGLSARWLS
jgi:hypothetical protein